MANNTINLLVFAIFFLHLAATAYSNEGTKKVVSQVANGQAGGQATGIASAPGPAPHKRIKGLNKRLKKRKARAPGAKVVFPVIPGKKYCVPKPNLSEQALKEQIDWGCKQGVDCDPIYNTREISCSDQSWFVKAAYVMNYYFNAHGREEASCNFTNHATLTLDNPSNTSCPMF
ncbi:Glucan endo-1 3-beta-glucosidase [Melia azedarach]|uniref:Glucan endo-1 3-beta-glucosidase n=1 Tax=Melia azedarach TaxID=155640 RepID=A0ACC1Y7Y9_MELAZ|nr:Glucan endo-1 3-beta-glucosidase [Melia azedarach]